MQNNSNEKTNGLIYIKKKWAENKHVTHKQTNYRLLTSDRHTLKKCGGVKHVSGFPTLSLTWESGITVQHKEQTIKISWKRKLIRWTKIQVDVAGYLYIPTKKDTRNRSESTHSYLTASSKPLTTNKKIMHLRLNGLLLSIVIWMESCLIGTNTTSSYI